MRERALAPPCLAGEHIHSTPGRVLNLGAMPVSTAPLIGSTPDVHSPRSPLQRTRVQPRQTLNPMQ